MTQMAGCWTHPTRISGLDLNALHTTSIRQEAFPPMTTALQAYLVSFGLTGVLDPEVLDARNRSRRRLRYRHDGRAAGLGSQPYRVTGWCTMETGGGVCELRGGAQHLVMKNGNHRVLVDSKLNPDRVVPGLLHVSLSTMSSRQTRGA
ncbi:LOW QUALITY PROTEIN: hypothetical protein MKX08_010528 [Trichoderma sp. CBMAI-0020]|nr:LOW QUALITY PROTEIN: hypothetical protein MKX08_010528 [Trichoderma sp. CBMAI-0020]